ncbi:membrane protein insertion efficiency factor YidD [Candidatus Peregrinibacteria bacterium]|nr:membrane protein insertion efficiency factor YidD [Candidatus Peregrinibacteria bacterium]
MKKAFLTIWHLPRNTAAFLITLYQKTLSPDHGWLKRFFSYGYCKYHPSCSQYAKESLMKYGLVKGGARGIWRILRCNPCSKGGEDKV